MIVSPPAQERAHSCFDASIIALPPALDGRLVPFDHSTLWCEKHEAHLEGTREWAFAEVDAWREDKDAAQLFWLVGSGGTGAPLSYTHTLPLHVRATSHLAMLVSIAAQASRCSAPSYCGATRLAGVPPHGTSAATMTLPSQSRAP